MQINLKNSQVTNKSVVFFMYKSIKNIMKRGKINFIIDAVYSSQRHNLLSDAYLFLFASDCWLNDSDIFERSNFAFGYRGLFQNGREHVGSGDGSGGDNEEVAADESRGSAQEKTVEKFLVIYIGRPKKALQVSHVHARNGMLCLRSGLVGREGEKKSVRKNARYLGVGICLDFHHLEK